jgi:alpha-glucosidase
MPGFPMLNHYRKILAFRKAHEALRVGAMSILKAEDGILIIERKAGDETILCVFNLSDERRDVALDRPGIQVISDHDFSGLYRDGTVHLGAFDAFFGKTD